MQSCHAQKVKSLESVPSKVRAEAQKPGGCFKDFWEGFLVCLWTGHHQDVGMTISVTKCIELRKFWSLLLGCKFGHRRARFKCCSLVDRALGWESGDDDSRACVN